MGRNRADDERAADQLLSGHGMSWTWPEGTKRPGRAPGPVAAVRRALRGRRPDDFATAVETLAAASRMRATPEWHHMVHEEWHVFTPPTVCNRVFLVHDGAVFDYAPSAASLEQAVRAARVVSSRPSRP